MLLAVQAADVVCGSLVNKLLPSDVWTTSSSCLSWLQNQMHNNNNNNKKNNRFDQKLHNQLTSVSYSGSTKHNGTLSTLP